MPLAIHVWSDIACPWCYVGKRHLEAALDRFEHADQTQVTWHSFELDPAAPKQYPAGSSYVERLAKKYGTTTAQAERMIDQMTERGRGVEIDFRFDSVQACNTFDAHRLLHFAMQNDKQGALKERLFAAYMTEGELISDSDTLVRLARDVGLDEERAHGVLQTDTFSTEVRADEIAAKRLEVTGVPFFVIGRYGVPGAQPPDMLLQVLERAWASARDVEEVDGPAD